MNWAKEAPLQMLLNYFGTAIEHGKKKNKRRKEKMSGMLIVFKPIMFVDFTRQNCKLNNRYY